MVIEYCTTHDLTADRTKSVYGQNNIAARVRHSLALCAAIRGDFDTDCDVDLDDFSIFASAWFTQPGEENYKPECNISIPPDNLIDWRDLAVVAEHWLAGI